MRLTVLGTGTARPLPDTPASGILVESEGTAVLFDIGSGIASRVEATIGALNLSGLVIGHFHADHWIDLAPLRYRFPWGEPAPAPVARSPGTRCPLRRFARGDPAAWGGAEEASPRAFRAAAGPVRPSHPLQQVRR